MGFANGLATPVALSATGIPTGTTASFNPASLSTSGTSTLTLTVGADTPQRTYNFTIVGKSGSSLTHTVTANLTIGASDFSVTLDSPAITFPSTGGPGTRTVTITPINGFVKTVTLSATGLPAGATAAFNPTAIAPGTPSTLTVTMPPGLAIGSYIVSIVGTSLDQAAGNPTRSTPLTLIVQPPGSLPPGWTSLNIGVTGLPASTGYTAGTFTIQASGFSIGLGADSCRFVYQTLSGDGTILVDLTRIQNPLYLAQYGLMIREDLTANARTAYMLVRNGAFGNDAAWFGARTTVGAWPTETGAIMYGYNRWLKLVRSGNTVTGYVSVDGFTWGTAVGSAAFTAPSLATNLYIGLAVAAGTTTATTTAGLYNPLITAGTAADFHLSPFPVTQIVPTGASSTSHSLRIDPVNGFAGTAALSVACPPSATCTLSSTSVAAGGFANLRLSLPAGLAPGPYTATVTATSGALIRTAAITVTVSTSAALPAPWTADNIGSVLTGTTSYANGVFSSDNTGDAIFGTAENFRYTYQSLTGDGVMVLRVIYYEYFGSAREGIMIRETLEPDSPKVLAGLSSSGGAASPALQHRSAKGGATTETLGPALASLPHWIKLVRQGNLFSGYSSHDGTSWKQIGSAVSVPMASTVFIGIAATSGSATTPKTATFDNAAAFSSPTAAPDFSLHAVPSTHSVDSTGGMAYYTAEVTALNGFTGNVDVTAAALPPGATATTVSLASGTSANIAVTAPPLAVLPYAVSITGTGGSLTRTFPVTLQAKAASGAPLPSPWAHLDIGTTGVPGIANYANGAYTVGGSGAQMFNYADNFHYAYQPIAGDATLIARVASTGNLTGTAKAGLMIRESQSARSPHAFVARQAVNGSLFQWRTDPGGIASFNNPPPAGKPWIKLVRQGNNFSAFHSDDSITWTQLSTAKTIPMRSSVLAGIAVSAENDTQLTTGTFDNLLIAAGPDFRLLTPTTTRTIGPSASAVYTINVDPLNNFAGPLTFALAGLPAGGSHSFSPSSWTGSGSVTLTVTAPGTVIPGDYPLTITGTGAGKTRTAVVTLTLRSSGFSITATALSPGTIIAAPATNPTSTITLAPAGGFTGLVTFSATGIPATLSFSNPTLTTSGTTTMTVLTTATTPGGNYDVIITATGPDGILVAQAKVALVVTNFTLAIVPTSQVIPRNQTRTFTITVTPQNGFNQTVTLSLASIIPNTTITFNPQPASGASSPPWQSIMSVKPKNSAPVITLPTQVLGQTAGSSSYRGVAVTLIIQ